jgi:hypothetical protein
VAEFAEINAQLEQVREAARAQAHSAAAEAVSSEVARAERTIPVAIGVAAQAGSQAVIATAGAIGVLIHWLLVGGRWALPVVLQVGRRLPKRTLPAVAALLLIMVGLTFVDLAPMTDKGTSLARSASGTAGTALSSATQAVQTALKANAAKIGDGEPGVEERAETTVGPATLAGSSISGMLAVFSRVPLELYVGGRRIGTSNDGEILLKPGRYRVELVNTRLNYRGETTLDIRPGAVTPHNVSLPNGLLQVNTEPDAEIWVEGERAGVAPLGAVPVPIGTRDVLVTHPEFGQRRQVVEVRYDGVTQLSIALRD